MALANECTWCGDPLTSHQVRRGGKYCSSRCYREACKVRVDQYRLLICVVCRRPLDRGHKITCGGPCRDELASRRRSVRDELAAIQRSAAKKQRRFFNCANCGAERSSYRSRKYCSRKCYSEHVQKSKWQPHDIDEIARKVATFGYRYVATELNLTKNQLLGRLSRRGYRMRGEFQLRASRGLHNTKKQRATHAFD